MKKLSISTLSIIACATAFLSAALRIVCLLFFYDDIGYYKSGAVLPIIANAIFALSLVFFLLAAIFSVDKNREVADLSKTSQYAALIVMGTLIFHGVRLFTTVVNESMVSKYVVLAAIILALVFFLSLSLMKRPNTVGVYLGIGAIIYVFLAWMGAYFDFMSPINSIDKTFFYIACAGAVLFIFSEMCACYGAVRSRFYYFSLFASIITLATASIPSILGAMQGIFRTYITFETDLFFVALLAYAVTRMMTLIKEPVAEALPEEENEEEIEEEIEEEKEIEEDPTYGNENE